MSYEVEQDMLCFFDDWEEEKIEAFLSGYGLTAWRPTVCGSCCGFYADEYGVSLSPVQVTEFNALATDNHMDAHADSFGIYVGAPGSE
jgi:hypothetical protein